MPLRQVWQKVPRADKIYCAPGNAGIAEYAECVDIGAMEFENWQNLPKKKRSIFASSGMDDPLGRSCGRIGRCGNPYVRFKEKRRYFGRIKSVFKRSYEKYDIPTAGYENFTDPKEAIAYLENAKFPIVLKADGLCTW